RDWAHARVGKLRRRLRSALRVVDAAHAQAATEVAHAELGELAHQARLLAKRTRYNIEAFGSLLPAKTTQRWATQAKNWQNRIGQSRDLARAIELLHGLQVAPELQAFLRGVAAAQATL
uniref:CHAD domain-containing protein n=1 Tax=Macromonas bipunctata TaxID=183670 RepID=UPI0011AF8590